MNKIEDEQNYQESKDSDDVEEIMNMIPASVEEKMGNDFIDNLRDFVKSSIHAEHIQQDTVSDLIEHADEFPFSDIQNLAEQSDSDQNKTTPQNIPVTQSVITDDHVKTMLSDLQTQVLLKWKNLTEHDFRHKLSCAEVINTSFTRNELIICLRVVQPTLKQSNIKCCLSWSKQVLVNLLSQQLGDGSSLQKNVKAIRRSPVKLKNLCKKTISKYPKQLLNIIVCEYRFLVCLETWEANKPFQRMVKLPGSNLPESWYSQPEYRPDTGKYLFGVLDGHHLLTNARAKCCSSGKPRAKIMKNAWLKVAKDSKNNGTKINLSMVEDLIDRQSNAFAQRTFSAEVEQQMRKNGDVEEAEFCRLIRNWYFADDEPGIPAVDRCLHRLELWLLSKYNCYKFPPPGSHVADIPVVLFEGLVTNCERKIQLYGFVKGGCYNARTISSLDSENFFSDFQELDPKGTGTIRPEDIPRAFGTAVEIINARINPERNFTIRTSNAAVYPSMEPADNPVETGQMVQTEGDGNNPQASGLSELVDYKGVVVIRAADGPKLDDNHRLVLKDHIFDAVSRRRRKAKRKHGDIAYPDLAARGMKGVQQHHRADESKILPTVRLGIPLE